MKKKTKVLIRNILFFVACCKTYCILCLKICTLSFVCYIFWIKFILHYRLSTPLFSIKTCITLFKIWRMRIKIMNDSHIKSLSDHICIHLPISYHCPLTAYIYRLWYICCISHLYDYRGGGLSWQWINVDKRDRGTRSIQITFEFCPLETKKFVLYVYWKNKKIKHATYEYTNVDLNVIQNKKK